MNRSDYRMALGPHTLTRLSRPMNWLPLSPGRPVYVNYTRTGNSQIDFIMVRIPSADQTAERVLKQTALFGACKKN